MAGMKAIKPEANADAYWFLAQHPRGVQPLWLEYFKNRIYKLRSGHPNFNEGAVEIQAIVEDTDKDARHRRLNHTRFRFHPISSVEHQAEVLHVSFFFYFSLSNRLTVGGRWNLKPQLDN